MRKQTILLPPRCNRWWWRPTVGRCCRGRTCRCRCRPNRSCWRRRPTSESRSTRSLPGGTGSNRFLVGPDTGRTGSCWRSAGPDSSDRLLEESGKLWIKNVLKWNKNWWFEKKFSGRLCEYESGHSQRF